MGSCWSALWALEVRKGAVGRRPRTWFRLTAAGRQALAGHLAWLAQLEEAVAASARNLPDFLDSTDPCQPMRAGSAHESDP
jgi:DNA-binding PadR family transcriptional regulator